MINPDNVAALAAVHYDTDAYDTDDQQVFALLVDTAWAYERLLRATWPDPTDDHGVPHLGNAVGMTPREQMIQALIENLEMKETGDLPTW